MQSQGNEVREDRAAGVVVIVAYRPLPGKEAELLQLTREHVPILRREGLATERPFQAMRAADGTIVEVGELFAGFEPIEL